MSDQHQQLIRDPQSSPDHTFQLKQNNQQNKNFQVGWDLSLQHSMALAVQYFTAGMLQICT